MKPNEIDERERRRLEARRRCEELLNQPIPIEKPKLVAIETSPRMARAIETNPKSLKLIAEDPRHGVTVVDRPYARGETVTVLVDRVAAVDGFGRPTGGGGVVSDYDIYATLRRE